MREPAFCIMRKQSNHGTADISVFVFPTLIVQSLYFLDPKFQSSVVVQSGLFWTWSETPKTFSHDAAHM